MPSPNPSLLSSRSVLGPQTSYSKPNIRMSSIVLYVPSLSGTFVSPPKFTSARRAHVAGCIEFFIPVVKWGINFTQDGNWLNEHSSRFAKSGAYGAWLKLGDMTDYILLDCCMTIPGNSFPSINVSLLANSCANIISVSYCVPGWLSKSCCVR
jgi:hypothetical protein